MARERLSRDVESHDSVGGNQCQAVNPLYGYEMAMAQGPNINRKRCFSSMQVQRRNPHCVIASCRHQLSRSSWAKQRLSPHLPWQQATWLTEGSEHCIALFQITVRSSLGPPRGAWELSYSIRDYESVFTASDFSMQHLQNDQNDARCKPPDELMRRRMVMMTTTLNQQLRFPVIYDLQMSLGKSTTPHPPPTPNFCA